MNTTRLILILVCVLGIGRSHKPRRTARSDKMQLASLLNITSLSHVGLLRPRASTGRRPARLNARTAMKICAVATAEPLTDPSVEEYNRKMAERMGWTNLDNPFEYRPERGE